MAHIPWIETDEGPNGRIFFSLGARWAVDRTSWLRSLLGLQAPTQQQKGNGVDRLFRWHSYLGRLGIIRCAVTRLSSSCGTAA